MIAFSKISGEPALFECHQSLSFNSCSCCSSATNENANKLNHTCGLEEVRNEANYIQCRKCLVNISSSLWHYFHQKRCTVKNKFKKFTNNFKSCQGKRFACDQCGYRSEYKQCLERHKYRKHIPFELQALFQCEFCEFNTRNRDYLQIHLSKKHLIGGSQKLFQCSYCEYKTTNKSYLRTHSINVHSSKELQTWLECDYCIFKTKYVRSLKLHIHKKHTADELQTWFRCDHCTFKALSEPLLTRHIYLKHKILSDSLKLLPCDQCEYKALEQRTLKA